MNDLNIGRRLVEHALHTGDLQPLLDAGFTTSWLLDKDQWYRTVFQQQEDKDAYQHILRHWDEHGVVPTREIFAKSFPLYKPKASAYEASELVEIANKEIKDLIIDSIVAETAELHENGNIDAALAKLKEASTGLSVPLSEWANELQVQSEMKRLRVRREAQRRVDLAEDNWQPLEYLRIADVPELNTAWRISNPHDPGKGLIAMNATVMIVAQAKVGKTTFVLNLLRALLSGGQFLGLEVTVPVQNITVLDLEMTKGMLRRWAGETGLLQHAGLRYCFLAGQASRLRLFDDRKRAEIAAGLRNLGTEILIVDPLGPVIGAQGLNENDSGDIRRVLNALNELKAEAEVSELIVVHHAGHGEAARARGSSVFIDSPDATITLQSVNEQRMISARGRDVSLESQPLRLKNGRLLETMYSWGKNGAVPETVTRSTITDLDLYDMFPADRYQVADKTGLTPDGARDRLENLLGRSVYGRGTVVSRREGRRKVYDFSQAV